MKIAIAGASGFIGKKLIDAFTLKNWQITKIMRSDFDLSDSEFAEKLGDADVVINLAGAPILKRWTFSYKKTLTDSRILTTRKIRNAIHVMRNNPQLFISTSAVGFYPDGGPYTESDRSYFPSFLSDLCRDWENEALLIENDCRLVIFRFGVVLDSAAGALARILPIFKMGLGGKIGKGSQGFSWIHSIDLVNAYVYVIEKAECNGIFNLTSPNPVNNNEFTLELAKTIHRPAFMPVPSFVLKMLYGEASVTLFDGQKVLPKRLLDAGFSFTFPEISAALKNLLQN